MKELTIVDAGPLREELLALGFVEVHGPRDAHVALPHVEFLHELFNTIFGPKFSEESNDCDDFAERFVVETSKSLQKVGVKAGHSVLYCEVAIKPGCELNGVRDGFHATNIVKCADESWVFFEPQNGKVTHVEIALPSLASLDFVFL